LVDQLDKKSSRIVIVGSGVHNPEEPGGDVGSKAALGDLSGIISGFKKPITMIDNSNYDADKAYKDSKLCNVMTALELARRLKSKRMITTCNVMNPGLIPTTGLFRELNPVFVFLFTILTRYVFKVAATEEEGGARLAFMVST
jgi:protochlorophyllide reductase